MCTETMNNVLEGQKKSSTDKQKIILNAIKEFTEISAREK